MVIYVSPNGLIPDALIPDEESSSLAICSTIDSPLWVMVDPEPLVFDHESTALAHIVDPLDNATMSDLLREMRSLYRVGFLYR
jgi:hypothetical protein